MVTDPIADMLIQLKNASFAGKRVVELPYSRMKLAIAKTLTQEGYIKSTEKTGSDIKPALRITLVFQDKTPVITNVRRKSKPGLRVYVGKHEIPRVLGGVGITIISTPQGIMTGKEAKKRGIGGELLCEIW